MTSGLCWSAGAVPCETAPAVPTNGVTGLPRKEAAGDIGTSASGDGAAARGICGAGPKALLTTLAVSASERHRTARSPRARWGQTRASGELFDSLSYATHASGAAAHLVEAASFASSLAHRKWAGSVRRRLRCLDFSSTKRQPTSSPATISGVAKTRSHHTA